MKEHKLKMFNVKLTMMWESINNLRKKKDKGKILDEERITLRDLEANYLSTQREYNRLKREMN